MEGVRIYKIKNLGTNEKGSTFCFNNERTGEFLIGHRKSGSISGCHYHKGKSAYKNPEILVLLSGEIDLSAENLKTGEKAEWNLSGPVQVEIDAYVWHEIHATSDIVFLEESSLQQHVDDVFYEKDLFHS